MGVRDSKEIPKHGSIIAISGMVFYFVEYFLMVIAAGIVAALRYYNWSVLEIFFLLWPGNILVGYLIIRANDESGVDFTFFQGYSRLFKEFQFNNPTSKIIKVIILIPVVTFLIFMAGGRAYYYFFKNYEDFQERKPCLYIGCNFWGANVYMDMVIC